MGRNLSCDHCYRPSRRFSLSSYTESVKLQQNICSTMKIFIDNGHGRNTAGKRSPDGQFLEYYYNRIVARRVTAKLQAQGLDAELLVPEGDDVSLAERCCRVNAWCRVHGKENAICVSIHFNAYGNGSAWTSPSCWSIYTSVGKYCYGQVG